MIHQPQTGGEARFAHGLQNSLHLFPGQHEGHRLGLGDPQFVEHEPAGGMDAFAVETAQRPLSHFHYAGGALLFLAQKQEILADLALAQAGWIAIEMLGQSPEAANVGDFGRRPIIFKLDQLFELGDRRRTGIHMWGKDAPVWAHLSPRISTDQLATPLPQPMQLRLPRQRLSPTT